ncbi:TerB family tellurite resistance protein [Labilibaculum sp. A4]|uniref:TerB family tellurite resistance protein n=1 Tax=Labilibaculum euxinus TaxID=2686357 RepID=UPI000F619E54|nr:TerB family tellurite resistance protein [Labilibaculum euxinus]MDQ1770330.1 hypothetical protein [Labilibaculum euxinus]MWN75451.1 TerB family tellurite resistance protein [Labilibaculum euxinus]
MRKEEKLYEVFGELLYALAKADGVIKKEEKETLTQLLKNHALGSEILWSFEFEESHNSSVEEIYNKVINFCHVYGPAPQYDEFITAMKIVADASDGMTAKEHKLISSFSEDLMERFQRDIDKLKQFEKKEYR